jgi:hypothetical protein
LLLVTSVRWVVCLLDEFILEQGTVLAKRVIFFSLANIPHITLFK